MSRPIYEARETMRRLAAPAPALFDAIEGAGRLPVLIGEVPMADFSPFGDFSFSPGVAAGGVGDRKARAIASAAPRREAREPVTPGAALAGKPAAVAPQGQGKQAGDAGPPVFSFRKRQEPLAVASQQAAGARAGAEQTGSREIANALNGEGAGADYDRHAESEVKAGGGTVSTEASPGFWAEFASRSADELLARGPEPAPERMVAGVYPALRAEPLTSVSPAASGSESETTLSAIDRVASAILSAETESFETRGGAASAEIRVGLGELREVIRRTAADPPAHAAGSFSPPALEAEEIAELVNDVLAEQARRHGVDLS